MSLQALLVAVDPVWYRRDARVEDAGDAPDAALLAHAQASALGRRMLATWLLDTAAPHLFAPRADGGVSRLAAQWPRTRLSRLVRDLGVLAFAPAIRAEVRREPVRTLKRLLGNSYLLALDKAVWDGRVDDDVGARLLAQLHAALAADEQADATLLAMFDRQGRAELRAWATTRDRAFGEWTVLQWPHEDAPDAHLPEKQVLFLHGHHEQRADD
jgi:hypothetical protein